MDDLTLNFHLLGQLSRLRTSVGFAFKSAVKIH